MLARCCRLRLLRGSGINAGACSHIARRGIVVA
jgi:hypothetical protein